MRVLKDKSGIYLVAAIVSAKPVPIKGDRHDQQKVTETHTVIETAGGNRHDTTIPWDLASKVLLEAWGDEPAPAEKPAA
jgi:hypothetical protein